MLLHSLKSCPELNGCRGRVLPLSGPGAPASRASAGRVPVRLAESGREVAVRPDNLRSPHTEEGGAASSGAAAPGAAAAMQPAGGQQGQEQQRRAQQAPHGQQQQAQQAQQGPRAAMLRLLEEEFKQWHTGATLTATNLR